MIDDNNDILCPWCNGNYLHHFRVDIHERAGGEDGASVVVSIEAGNGEPWLEGKEAPGKSSNPSSRRDGVTVMLVCENCCKISEIQIAQHKGQTGLRVEKHVPREAPVAPPVARPLWAKKP